MEPPSETPPIQAYYKLSFPNFEYYLQTLSVTIGRRPQQPTPEPSSSTRNVIESPVKNEIVDPEALLSEPVKLEEVDPLLRLAEVAGATISAVRTPQPDEAEDRPPSPQPSSSSARRSRRSPSRSTSAFPHVDVDLGPLKSVSRLHARIDYDDTIDKFVLYVNGRNGAWVDGQWIGCGGRVALGARLVAVPNHDTGSVF